MAEPYPEDLCFYRGVKKEYTESVLKKMKIGDIIIDRGFSSQTISIDIANDFADKSGGLMMLCYSKNTKFLYLPFISKFPDEREVLTYPSLKLEYKGKKNIKCNNLSISNNYEVYVFDAIFDHQNYIPTLKINIDYDPAFLYNLKNQFDNIKSVYDDRYIFGGWNEIYLQFDYKKYKAPLEFYNKKSYIKYYIDFALNELHLFNPNLFPNNINELNKKYKKLNINDNSIEIPFNEQLNDDIFDTLEQKLV